MQRGQQRIVQVVSNLLSNAERYAAGTKTIRFEAVRGDLCVEVSVVVEGSGIPTERLPYLFRKYTRSDRDDRGVGPGLCLFSCKSLV